MAVQGNTSADYVGAAVWRFFVPGVNPFVEVSDTLVLTGDCKVRFYSWSIAAALQHTLGDTSVGLPPGAEIFWFPDPFLYFEEKSSCNFTPEKETKLKPILSYVSGVQTFVMQPMQREGKVLTYVAGISGFEESRLHELNQTRCDLVLVAAVRPVLHSVPTVLSTDARAPRARSLRGWRDC